MPTTYKKITTVTVGSGGASTISFTSIPQTYTDLVVKISGRSNRSEVFDNMEFRLNGSTTSADRRYLLAYNGNTLISGSDTNIGGQIVSALAGDTATASTFGNTEVYIPNYTSNNYKSFSGDAVGENNASNSRLGLNAVVWANTSAVTSIEMAPSTGTLFKEYSTATLYGVKNS